MRSRQTGSYTLQMTACVPLHLLCLLMAASAQARPGFHQFRPMEIIRKPKPSEVKKRELNIEWGPLKRILMYIQCMIYVVFEWLAQVLLYILMGERCLTGSIKLGVVKLSSSLFPTYQGLGAYQGCVGYYCLKLKLSGTHAFFHAFRTHQEGYKVYECSQVSISYHFLLSLYAYLIFVFKLSVLLYPCFSWICS